MLSLILILCLDESVLCWQCIYIHRPITSYMFVPYMFILNTCFSMIVYLGVIYAVFWHTFVGRSGSITAVNSFIQFVIQIF